jgi:hypothetical protein
MDDTAAFSRPGMGTFERITSPNAPTAMGLNEAGSGKVKGGVSDYSAPGG